MDVNAFEGTFRDRISANKRNSLLLVAVFIAFVAIFGYVIGFAWGCETQLEPSSASSLAFVSRHDLRPHYLLRRRPDGSSAPPVPVKPLTKKPPSSTTSSRRWLSPAGVPMPKVYIIDDTAPNAFATGRDPEHAAVAATSGLLEKLDRDELQGVMAHEMAHTSATSISATRCSWVFLVGTTVLISDFFLRSLWFGGGRRMGGNRGGGGGQIQLIMMLVGILFAVLAPIFARMLQLSISRQREYLADATAVKANPKPEGPGRRAGEDLLRQRGP